MTARKEASPADVSTGEEKRAPGADMSDSTPDLSWEPFWTVYEAAAYLSISPQRLYQLVADGRGPQAYRVSDRALRFKPQDVRVWVETRKLPRKENTL